MRKKLYLLLLVLLMVVVAAGCGSQQTAGSGENNTPADNSTPAKVFSYAMSGAYRPFNFFNEQNELTGFDVEIGKALAAKMGLEPKPIATPWQGLIEGLKAKRYDAIIGSMTITDKRLQEVNFSDPYYISGAQLFVRPDSPVTSLEDLNKETKIGVTIATVYEEEARKYSDSIKTYDSDITALRDLANNRLDAVITDRFVGKIAIQESKLAIKPVGDLIFVERIGIAIRKGDDELLAQVNNALKAIKDDGTYLQISKKYFDEDISKE